MWRWVTLWVILVLVGRPIMLINNPACDEPERDTAVATTDTPPCHDTLEPAEASPGGAHSCPCPAMLLPGGEIGTAVPSFSSLWLDEPMKPQTAVHIPPSPPPRLI